MRATLTPVLLSAAAVLCLAAPAVAAGFRVPVGDLTRPDAARAFHHRLMLAAERFCGARYSPVELDGRATCLAAVRREGVEQLSEAQRQSLARALWRAPELASAAG
ncbi:MAG TPA: UrcA family protein [Caulobacteraceae bacterium]|nr:UrcA family protein [Caulobacteraceae bacterium]